MYHDTIRHGGAEWLNRPAPLLGWRGAVISLLAALVLCWPMLATGGYLIFADTESYIRGGEIIWGMVVDMIGPAAATDPGGVPTAGMDAAADGAPDDDGPGYVVRSFVYSMYTLAAGAALWPAGFAMLQSAMTLYVLLALVGPEAASRPKVLGAGFLLVAAFTTLPWFTVYLMPDMMAAAILIYAAVLVRRFDDLGPLQRYVLGAIAAFAVAAHYGHGPLAAALFGAVLLWRVIRGRISLAVSVAAILPVLFSPVANLGASSVALETTSVAPLRLPILLARSIEDGPARWYLQEACPEAPLAFCDAFGDRVPTNIAEFLWRDEGIESLTPEMMARIRDEEFVVLVRAFQAYPLKQSVSLFENAALQLVRVGTGEIFAAGLDDEGRLDGTPSARADAVIDAFDVVTPIATLVAALLLLAMLATGRLRRGEIEVLAVVVLGLLINAGIFGGLSAPVDRYQSRVAWLLPALAVLFVARSAGAITPHPSPS